ncbi:hypothetical protein JAAARDRAFT_33097 [Jaapia argillacea MUCL 33604]|uniref:AMP-dependent synthetase/ligase domain-containing protein n=1 Tax=Jaapia argillacea MUCL 33604 TaxID=933084 RepID=A0A067QAB1_9AGAM|nr:hypothetical protein JAAARDRAFT_33097 [Jaapia argillacea MUCL 33604]
MQAQVKVQRGGVAKPGSSINFDQTCTPFPTFGVNTTPLIFHVVCLVLPPPTLWPLHRSCPSQTKFIGAMALTDYLVTDDLTILLSLVAASLFLLHNLYRPQPLVHPILLGRQSDAARVRNPKESAVYRNYGTGMLGRLPMRPAKDVNLVGDLVKPDSDAERTLWNTKITNAQLKERVAAFGTGLVRHAGLIPKDSSVLLLLNDSIEFLITDLALASHQMASFTLTSLSLLSPLLESHPPSAIITHAHFLPQLLELIYDSHEHGHHTIIVVGEINGEVARKGLGVTKVFEWAEVEKAGSKVETVITPAPGPNDVFTVSFYPSSTSPTGFKGAHLTHANITAGVTATRLLLPLSNPISPMDSMLSAHSLSTAFGRAVAYTAIYEGTSFGTVGNSAIFRMDGTEPTRDIKDLTSSSSSLPSPTILFIFPSHLRSLTISIISRAKSHASSLLFPMAWRHKLSAISEGFLSKGGLWDRLVFEGARQGVVGEGAGSFRGIVVAGGPVDSVLLTPARIALSVPLVNAHIHPLVSGPVMATHLLDLQSFVDPTPQVEARPEPTTEDVAHVGPPAINIEVKLVGVDDDAVEAGADPEGEVFVKGPSVGSGVGVDGENRVGGEEEEGWVSLEERARVLTNGTFKIVGRKA